MKNAENITAISSLPIDRIGFIFYPLSKRYLLDAKDVEASKRAILALPKNIERVGVFVNTPTEEIVERAKEFALHSIQLHGNESPESCEQIKANGLTCIKAFAIKEPNDFNQTAAYEGKADFFLFDTKCEQYGGSGEKFDWSILQAYKGNSPFILSGGIAPDSVDALLQVSHKQFSGIDLNSKFENSQGEKERELLSSFIKQLKQKK